MTLDKVVEKYVTISKQRLLLFLTSLAWIYDAAGVIALSFTLPAITNEWTLSPQASANLASSTFLGMLVGALSVGVVADIFGRKMSNVLYFSLTFFFTFLLGFSKTPAQFILLRFLAGVGYGGLMPSVNAYLSEFTGIKIRGKYLVLLEASWAIGSILIGLISVLTINNLGWRWTYWVFASGLVLLPLFFVLPESPKFAYIKKGKEGLEKVLGQKIEENVEIVNVKSSLLGVFSKQFFKVNIAIFTSWFVVSFVYYTLFTWAPKIFAQQGLSATRSLWFTFFMMVAQLPGYLSAAYFIEKIGRKKSLVFYFVGTAISGILWGFVSNTVGLIVISTILSFFTLGVWGLVYAYTPEVYPTQIRGSGNGIAGVVARISGILAPQFGGFMLQKNVPLLYIFSVLSVLAILAGVVVHLLGVETKGKEIA